MDDEQMVRVRSVEPLQGFLVRLGFTNGSSKEIDLEPFLRGPVFDPVREDTEMFRQVSVDHRAGTIVWPNGADIDPDVLYLGLKPAWMEAQEEELLTK
jgi:hypothetical protein